jgi:CheY-like chemotaxis protein
MPTLDLKNKKILVVEDDEMNFLYLNQIFLITNATITRARNGNEAIQICMNHGFDLILMDIQLPDIDGIEVTKTIRKKNTHTPVIAQTASRSEHEIEMMLKAGCSDVVVKPFKMENLLSVIEKYI